MSKKKKVKAYKKQLSYSSSHAKISTVSSKQVHDIAFQVFGSTYYISSDCL